MFWSFYHNILIQKMGTNPNTKNVITFDWLGQIWQTTPHCNHMTEIYLIPLY